MNKSTCLQNKGEKDDKKKFYKIKEDYILMISDVSLHICL